MLRATLEELGRVGYSALRIEDVAQLSDVNKTTIYRRWPTKLDLVAAAIRSVKAASQPAPDTGSLREDLLAAAREMLDLCNAPARMGIVRMLHAEQQNPEVMALRRTLRDEYRQRRQAMVERAILRGELPAGTSSALVIEAIFSPLGARLITLPEPIDETFVRGLVDLVLAGARAGGAVVRPAGS